MTTAETLRAARALIDTPDKWTQGCYALDAEDKPVDERDPKACRFCASGAMWRAVGADVDAHEPARNAFMEAVGESTLTFNDRPSTTHADVVAAFDKAIAEAEGRVAA